MKFKKCFLLLLAVIPLLPYPASALLIGDDGPEPIIIQLKESIRQSEAFDVERDKLAALLRQNKVRVVKRWAGAKYLEMLAFPKDFTEAQALAVVAKLQQISSVEKVVTLSALNLEFRSGDFTREFGPNQAIPEAAARGLDFDRISRGPDVTRDIARALEAPHVANRIIVRWKDEYVWQGQKTGFGQRTAEMHAQTGCRVINELAVKTQFVQTLEFDEKNASVAEMLSRYQASELVDYAQPDYIYAPNLLPNDPGYYNPGQPALSIISAPAAWDLTTGNDNWILAVGDTGANGNHPDLSTNLWGGYNFISNNFNYADDNGHGTHVASIAGAQGNNGQYITGVAWNVRLMHLKVLGANGSGTSTQIASGINYAWQNGAIGINLSLGSQPTSVIDTIMRDAIRNARNNNMVVVAAAGNGTNNDGVGVNSDLSNKLVNPASIPVDNVIAVGSTNSSDARSGFSNYGIYRVDLAAPGENILGLYPDPNYYNTVSGTSQASPHVAGTLVLVKDRFPWENATGLRDRVLMGVDEIAGLTNTFRMGGRLNAFKSLQKRNLVRNLSTRARVETGDRIMIGGFYIAGTGTLKVGIRGLGPSLPPLSVARLNNPTIRLYNSAGQQVFANDDWNNLPQDQKNELISLGLAPADGREAAMIQTLAAGAYTVFLESQDGQLGVGSFEIYELENNSDEQTRLVNVSARCKVGVGDEVVIAGAILGDPAQANNPLFPRRRILAFGKGPSMTYLTGVLANPLLEVRNSAGTLITSNDQWQNIDGTSTGLQDELVESGFAPASLNESAVWPTFRPGSYTMTLKGVSSGTGTGLIELYEY
jgi:thermitase